MNYFQQRQQIAQGLINIPEKRAKEKKDKADVPLPYNELMKLAQATFNAWIRRRDSLAGCFTCNQLGFEAGHFYAAGSFSGLRFSEMNVHKQCTECNQYEGSNHEAYLEAMKRTYTSEQLENLANNARLTKKKKWSREELNHIIKKYKL